MAAPSPSDLVNQPRFHRTFQAPLQTPGDGSLRNLEVKYGDYGYRNESHPEEENVLLFFSSLMGSRLLHIAKDDMAKKHEVRIISVDRPGIGGTESVDAKERLRVHREIIIALLAHLGIPHVSLVCHSGGTIYALDLLLHHPEILHPERPYLAIGSPWILPSHTGLMSMSIVQALPGPLVGQVDKLARLINDHVGPFIGKCFGVSQTFVAKVTPSPASTQSSQESAENTEDYAKIEDRLWPKIMQRAYAENIQGVSSDALLFLQKLDGEGGWGDWGDWGDYDCLVPRLRDSLEGLSRTLTVDVFYAEQDAMIGDGKSKGPAWFDNCWSESNSGGTIQYRSRVIEHADHDSIWSLRREAMQEVLTKVGQTAEHIS